MRRCWANETVLGHEFGFKETIVTAGGKADDTCGNRIHPQLLGTGESYRRKSATSSDERDVD